MAMSTRGLQIPDFFNPFHFCPKTGGLFANQPWLFVPSRPPSTLLPDGTGQ